MRMRRQSFENAIVEREGLICDEKRLTGLVDETTMCEREIRRVRFQGTKIRRRRSYLGVIGG